MGAELWEPLRPHGSLSARIASNIEELILNERIKAGERLPPERELAVMLGVSRPSLREAISSLAASGRLTVRHGLGVFVESPETTRRLRNSLLPNEHDVDELYAMREVLEVPAAGWAAKNVSQGGNIDQLAPAYEALSSAVDGLVPWADLQRLDAAFHEAVVKVSGNRFLLRTLGVLNEIMVTGMQTTLGTPGRLVQSSQDHAEIFRAITIGDVAWARRAVRNHIRGAHATARAYVDVDR